MPVSWSELATLFGHLEPRLAAARLEYSEHDGAARWTFVSEQKDPAPLEFVTLARIAGEQLTPIARFLHQGINAESDPCARWYLALRHHSGMHLRGRDARVVVDGEFTGEIRHRGSISRPATASAVLCDELSRHEWHDGA